MPDFEHQLQDYWSEITSDLPEPSLDTALQKQVGDGAVRPLQKRRPAKHRAAWAVAVVAFAGVLLFGGAMLLLVGEGDSTSGLDLVTRDTTSSTAAPPTTTTPPTTAASAVTIVSDTWNPILADTRAREAPPAAICPPDTDPDRPGQADQERPTSIAHNGLNAAFDHHTGRIVYVDAAGKTWTFEVCTNTWQEMNPRGSPFEDEDDLFDLAGEPSGVLGSLVYDIDSDRTVEFGATVYVYDANTDTWTSAPNDDHGPSTGPAAYDPVTGLILVTAQTRSGIDLWAYDVDTNTWTSVGSLWLDGEDGYYLKDFLGYSVQIDRLIFGSDEQTTALVDPRTGTIELVDTPSPNVNLGWPNHSYGQANDTVFVNRWNPVPWDATAWDGICGFDFEALEWSRCYEAPRAPDDRIHPAFAAMVDDPINDRLILINGRYGDWWGETDAAVWAIDLHSGDLVTLVAPADER